MGTKRPKTLFYVLVKDVRTRPRYKTKLLTVYANGVPTRLKAFVKWLEEAIEEKTKKGGEK